MLALKDIAHNLLRFALTALGIGLLTAGTLTINGIYNGVVADSLNLAQRVNADLWVVENDTDGPLAGGSQLNRSIKRQAASITGVASTRYFELMPADATVGGNEQAVSLLAIDFPDDTGSWQPLLAGRALASVRGEAVADALAGFGIGQHVEVGGETLRIVGLTSGMVEANGEPILAVSVADLDAIRAQPSADADTHGYPDERLRWPRGKSTSAVLVEVRPGHDPGLVAARLEALEDVRVMTQNEQIDTIENGRLSRMRLQILLFSGLLTIITGLVVSVTIYTMTVEKQHTIALLKLIGAAPSMIGGLIVTQALLLGALGLVAGLVLQQGLAPMFPRRVVLMGGDVATITLAIGITCLLGASLGIVRATRVRPQEILS